LFLRITARVLFYLFASLAVVGKPLGRLT